MYFKSHFLAVKCTRVSKEQVKVHHTYMVTFVYIVFYESTDCQI